MNEGIAGVLDELFVAGLCWSPRFAPDCAPLPLRCAGRRFQEKLGGEGVCRQAGPMIFSEDELQKHYRLLLGIQSPWQVKNVKLDLSEKRVEIELTEGAKAQCPVCGQDCSLYDYAPERTWRHLDTMHRAAVSLARLGGAVRRHHG